MKTVPITTGGMVSMYMQLLGKHLGIYASLRDNHEEKMLSGPEYLNTRPGAVYKSGQDYSEMRGGMTWAWKWGMLGLVKDHLEWGNNYHYPSILSAKAPSFTQLKLRLSPVKWFEFNYYPCLACIGRGGQLKKLLLYK